MVFSKLFGKSAAAAARPAPEPEPDDDSPSESAEDDGRERWAERARNVIVGGASTGSKRAAALYGDADGDWPTHYRRAAGCHVETIDGESLIDCTMALGSVALGYAEPELTRAVIETLAAGSVSGLSPALEIDVAERFCAAIPCSDRVQFLKTGADAVSAAVRIARTYTGRDIVIACGYFGWHDWAQDAAGVPAATRNLVSRIPFDDVPALQRAVSEAGQDLAAIVVEPVIARLPSREWAEQLRALSTSAGAVLVFDELKTGFRLATGGYQQYAEIEPDLAAFGKAMANGFPLAAVCGHKALMDAAEKTWISSTLASEAGALAAARAVLAWHDKVDICESLWNIGKDMRAAVQRALDASGVAGVSIEGVDPMWLIRFDSPERETRFLTLAVRDGVLFKRGAYNFAAMAHDEDAILGIESGASSGFVALREGGDE